MATSLLLPRCGKTTLLTSAVLAIALWLHSVSAGPTCPMVRREVGEAYDFFCNPPLYPYPAPQAQTAVFSKGTNLVQLSPPRITQIGRTLKLNRLVMSDAGIYRCTTNNAADCINLEIVVRTPPSIIFKSPARLQVPVGQNHVIVCRSSDANAVYWKKDSRLIPNVVSASSRIRWNNTSQSLSFSPFLPEDKGNYSCEAENASPVKTIALFYRTPAIARQISQPNPSSSTQSTLTSTIATGTTMTSTTTTRHHASATVQYDFTLENTCQIPQPSLTHNYGYSILIELLKFLPKQCEECSIVSTHGDPQVLANRTGQNCSQTKLVIRVKLTIEGGDVWSMYSALAFPLQQGGLKLTTKDNTVGVTIFKVSGFCAKNEQTQLSLCAEFLNSDNSPSSITPSNILTTLIDSNRPGRAGPASNSGSCQSSSIGPYLFLAIAVFFELNLFNHA